MTAGLTSRPIAGTKVALDPAALVGLLGAALLAGGMLGAALTSELGSVSPNRPIAQVAAPGSSLESQAVIKLNTQIAVGRGPMVSDSGPSGPLAQGATHVADHIGLTERLFTPAQGATHVADHIGLTERLFPVVPMHATAWR